jgi:O-antigen biosynthesis protein
VRQDFAAIAASPVNVIRTYELPPDDVLDAAEEAGLLVMVGLHYDDWTAQPRPGRRTDKRVLDAGRRAVETALQRCSSHSCLLAISVGNEVAGDLVRVHGIGAVEHVLSALVEEVHAADPDLLVTYTNYPTTEYLQVAGQDFFSFNVFLERSTELGPYLRRLQSISGDLPLLISEVGLAADVHGSAGQAAMLDRQLRIIDEEGCVGAVVFSWTDEWAVGGSVVTGWGFGITDSARRPKPALEFVARWADRSLSNLRSEWPRISAVVCAHNEAGHIENCLRSLETTSYPRLDVIVCDDGSRDDTLSIARRFPFEVLALPHRGLGAARNAGVATARGDIVAFLDADARCHPEWPFFLALAMEDPNVAAAGGPNLPEPHAGIVERAVARSPGNPQHVMLSDDTAEHVPGCNMAVRKDLLERVGNFDPGFLAAGDDVDLCWKLLDLGFRIAFAPAAQVYHHRRASARAYLKQQVGYGRAERLVTSRHPHRLSRFGGPRWTGTIYGGLRIVPRLMRPVVYHGRQGAAAYQGVVRYRTDVIAWSCAMLPLALSLGIAALPFAFLSLWALTVPGIVLLFALTLASLVALSCPVRDESQPIRLRMIVAALHLLQPVARAWGRLRGRSARSTTADSAPAYTWDGDRTTWLRGLERALATRSARVRRGGPTDAWDLQTSIGLLVAGRLTTGVRWRWYPVYRFSRRPSRLALGTTLVAFALFPVTLSVAVSILVVVWTALSLEAVVLDRVVHEALAATTLGVIAVDSESRYVVARLFRRLRTRRRRRSVLSDAFKEGE